MKRAALGALLISLVAGSTAMAGTVLAPAYYEKYGQKSDDRHGGQMQPVDNRHDQGRNDGNRGRDHRNDGRNDRHDNRRDNDRHDNRWNGRDNGRHDNNWNRRDDHRNDRHFDSRRDDHRHYDGRRYDPPRYSPPPRHYDPPRYSSRPYAGRRFENGRWHWGSYYRPHGYYVRHWSRGDRLPVAYYGPTYIVREYRDCGLRAPPYGYHWVRVDHDVVLAAIATGLVLDVVYNQFW